MDRKREDRQRDSYADGGFIQKKKKLKNVSCEYNRLNG